MIKFNGINHLAMATGDMDATIRFWRDLLGCRLIAGLGRPGYRHYFFELSPTDAIAFFEWNGVTPIEERPHGAPRKGPIAFDHVSFGVETMADLWEINDRLTAADLYVTEAIDHGFLISIYAYDPNGIPIEFSWNKDTENIREQPAMHDPEPCALARQGPEPQPGCWPAVTHPTPDMRKTIFPGAGSEFFHGTK